MPTAVADGQQHQKHEEKEEIAGDKVEEGQDLAATSADDSERPSERERRVLAAAPIAETRRTRGGDGGAGTKIICDNKTKRREGNSNRESIDSRSILNNKQRLKRFWERRMELDSKSQSRQEINSEINKMTPRHRPAAMAERQNSSQNSIKLTSGKQMEFSPQRDGCDSPPPPPEQDENNNNNSGEQGGHVSAELLCEKLLAYEQTQRRSTHNGPEVPNGHQIRPQPAVAEANSQPMSIDPTLCHVNTTRTTTTTATLKASDQDEELDEEQDEEQVANEEFGSSNSSIVGPSQSGTLGTQANDNQTVSSRGEAPKRSRSASLDSGDSQEGTSTQSGSVLTVIGNNNNNNNNDSEKQPVCGANNGDELTGGRATPTLITSLEDEQEEQPLVDFGDLQSSTLGGSGGGGGPESDGSNIGVAFESLHFDDEIKSSRSEQVDEERLLAGLGTKKPALPVTAAVGSVVAKTQAIVKLADEEEEEAQHPRRGDKFSSREVRSVCALITSAISDAGRQVEGYLRQSSLANAQANAKVDPVSDVHDDDDESPITPTNQRTTSNNHNGRESSDEELESRDGFQRATFVARDESRRPTNQRQCVEQVATIGYLADEDEDEDEDQDEEEDDEDEDDDEQERQLSSPRADLSSMFEANVRREIERFESNTMLRRQQNQPGGCGQKSAGLTEWRIAEEIRLFNEREKELKQRCKSTTTTTRVHREQGAMVAPPGGANTKCHQQEQRLESIVRFGKTLQIPKPANETHQTTTTSRSIKLTTKGGVPSQPATTISMHKFISSGGKRFVYQTAQVNSSSSSHDIAASEAPQLRGSSSSRPAMSTTANPPTMDNHLTKSMSNLSTCATSSGRQVDYRAVDSLKCKEVPNVAPGFAKKTIETFARLNSETSLNKLGGPQDQSNGVGGSMASNLNNDHLARTKSIACTNSSGNLSNGRVQQQPMTHGGAGIPTAEWKIQEELREMKAREAELRSLRNQHHQQQQQPLAAIKPKKHNPIVANVKPVHQQRPPAATELVNGGAGKQRPLTRPNRFGQSHDTDDETPPGIHSAYLMSKGDNDNRDYHDDLESASGDGDAESGNESGCERIRPVNARGGCGTHAYQHNCTSQHNGSGNSTLVSGSCGTDDLAGGSDSLYPIKQTIDSFRKLNQQSAASGESSGDCNNNSGGGGGGQVPMTSAAHRSASSGLAVDRVRVNKKPPPPQGKQFVNSSSVGPQRPT